MSKIFGLILTSFLIFAFNGQAFGHGGGHSHGHCIKKIKGKEVELKRVKKEVMCKKRGGEWHTDDDGHDHSHHDHDHE